MALTAPYFSNSPDRIRSMRTVDLADMFNRSSIELNNSFFAVQPEPTETVEPVSGHHAPENSETYETDSMFQRVGGAPPFPRRRQSKPATVAPTTPLMSLAGDLTSFVKEFGGFNPKAYGDYKQVSIGYGTRANPGEKVISRQEAERRLATELANSRSRVEAHAQKHGYEFSPKQLDALTSFDYNTGRLEQLTAKGTRPPKVIAERMLQYNKAGGKVPPGLERRRKAEHQLFQTL